MGAGHHQGIALALGSIGLIYGHLGKPDEALRYLKKALEIFKRTGAQREVERVLEIISIIEGEKKKKIEQE